MSWLLKISNWLSGGALEKYREQAKLARARLEQNDLESENLKAQIQQLQMEIEQLQAQIQIGKGFQIELGETQVKLQQQQKELLDYQQKYIVANNKLEKLEAQLQQVNTELTDYQDWLQQLEAKIEVVAIEKRLPKTEFDTLWGFGITSPQPETMATAGSILIKGWVVGKKAKVNTVEIIYEGTSLLSVPVERSSPNIARRYPDIPKAGESGFELSLSIVAMPSEANLELQAVLENDTQVPICSIVLKRQ